MKSTLLLALLRLAAAAPASAATLTITPDKQTYQVGETITLSVFGDPEDGLAIQIRGRVLFDSGRATPVSVNQEVLTFAGGLPWLEGPLSQGDGFADAFFQIGPDSLFPVENALAATVVLLASAPGALDYQWQTDPSVSAPLQFFGLTTAPGGSVTIVPEPTTGLLLLVGLAALSRPIRSSKRRESKPAARRHG